MLGPTLHEELGRLLLFLIFRFVHAGGFIFLLVFGLLGRLFARWLGRLLSVLFVLGLGIRLHIFFRDVIGFGAFIFDGLLILLFVLFFVFGGLLLVALVVVILFRLVLLLRLRCWLLFFIIFLGFICLLSWLRLVLAIVSFVLRHLIVKLLLGIVEGLQAFLILSSELLGTLLLSLVGLFGEFDDAILKILMSIGFLILLFVGFFGLS